MLSSDGYKEARRLLQETFGKNEVIVTVHIQKILKWPSLKEYDTEGFYNFDVMLRTCRNELKGETESIRAIKHSTIIMQIVQKLPYPVQEKWCTKALEITDKTYLRVSYLKRSSRLC